jgi:cysteine desulfurase
MTVYLDHAATTPMRPEAVEAMGPFLGERFGNPSGVHAVARAARAAIDEARDVVAASLGADAGEIVFTGSGTEADNLGVAGVVAARGGRAVCSAIEHHAVLETVHSLGGTVVPVDGDGIVDLDRLRDVLDGDVGVVSVMLANNETGAVQPLAEIVDAVRALAPHALVHTDAVQAVSWLDVADLAASADLISISAHKFGGPMGVGALVVRDRARVAPIIHGGGQERERRSGTHNVAGIVGMAAALRATVDQRDATVARVRELRDELADGLLAAVPDSRETGRRATKVASVCHVLFDGVESEALLLLLDDAGVCASAGSACASGALEPSHVLTAMGIDDRLALSSLRLSLGWPSTADDVAMALKVIPDAVARLRETS